MKNNIPPNATLLLNTAFYLLLSASLLAWPMVEEGAPHNSSTEQTTTIENRNRESTQLTSSSAAGNSTVIEERGNSTLGIKEEVPAVVGKTADGVSITEEPTDLSAHRTTTEALATRLDEAQRAFAIVTNTKKSEIVNRSVLSSVNVSSAAAEETPRHVRKFTGDYDYYAPDGSRIKKLAAASRGDIAYCTLPAGKISSPVQHKTVEELWCVKSGKGELWLKGNEVEGNPDQVIALEENVTLFIPPGTPFQFRNIGEAQLDIVMTTMPCWPGPDEAIKVEEGLWKPSEEPEK